MTDDERREVARRLRNMDYDDTKESLICAYLDALGVMGEWLTWVEIAHRLADLIDPPDGFDLDAVQRVCLECMEGCDEPEWTLYTTIHDAIARYKRGESGPTCDRDALLALADDMRRHVAMDERSRCHRWVSPEEAVAYADRIREALGIVDE